ncbi:hypothetical protein Dsin_014711 [Dipteronia sinensis]|uniref:C2 NT-type domain-containing protein n=1 Tax=Dipteronia sinensis TaxID=43782 RepID=A0AAE0AMJ1_9ROSI|nr:hypothetical protein Dsin_014711 [Dipteronia sinensis]
MFKSWRNDKNKIKAVFKLQFQATQVPRLKKSAVMISLVPEDAGKRTVKLEKVAVQDGTCTWENPLYEIMKLIKETKTGKIKEKIYHFIVSTGSSKSGFLGEASIDFADFAAETEPLTVTLPLKFANSGAILHVSSLSLSKYISIYLSIYLSIATLKCSMHSHSHTKIKHFPKLESLQSELGLSDYQSLVMKKPAIVPHERIDC